MLVPPVPDMSSQHPENQFAQLPLVENLYQTPQTFADAIAHIKTLILEEFDRKIAAKQLCYHTHEHIEGVQSDRPGTKKASDRGFKDLVLKDGQ